MNYLESTSETGFTHRIGIKAAYDLRDPDPRKNCGIHGMHIYFQCVKDKKGITFSVSSNWHLPSVDTSCWSASSKEPLGFSVDYHMPMAAEEVAEAEEAGEYFTKDCSITCGACRGGGSGLLGEEFLAVLIAEGHEGLFKRMEKQFALWIEE